ncbi:MAG TPA: SDR family NAD(P)-dependent oxidoreductase [Streptosporangiaceae bacterium]|jgi:NAD(P)-dependent dehydrogenase (short-subunit alcohol dehydrogenase family)
MDLRLSGKTAIVTGASRGIGFAIADALAGEGADVVLVARDTAALDTAAARLARHPGRALAVQADTTDDDAVRAMVARAADVFGGVDILVNAAARPGGAGGRGGSPSCATTTYGWRSRPRSSATCAARGRWRRT